MPWSNFFNDFFFLQFCMLYIMYMMYFSNNLYFVLFYLFIEFFFFGVFLAVYNLELFTAFLWLTECVMIFVSILFLFYLNVYGNINKLNLIMYSFSYFGMYIGFFFIFTWMNFPFELESTSLVEFNTYYNWDNYYEALYNMKMNDLFSLFMSYYCMNSFEFIMLGLLLLFISLVCVNLNKFNKNFKLNNYYNLLTLFDFFNDFINFFFLSKQNLVDQENHVPGISLFKKK